MNQRLTEYDLNDESLKLMDKYIMTIVDSM